MFTQQLLNGIGIGCTYALIALGYNLIFGVMRVVNVAYGEIFMVSAFATLMAAEIFPGFPMVTIIAALLVAVVTGLVVHLIAVKPLGEVADINSPRHLSVIISTLGCSVVLQYLAIEFFGGYPHRVPRLFPQRTFTILNSQLDLIVILNITISFISMALLYLLLNRTLTGLRIRALAENSELARCGGQRTSWDQLLSIIVSSALAGVAAVLITQTIGTVSPYIGLSYGLKGLVILIVGGAGNMIGAVAVALLMGTCEVFAVAYLSSSYRDAVAYGLLVLILVFRAAIGEWRPYRIRNYVLSANNDLNAD